MLAQFQLYLEFSGPVWIKGKKEMYIGVLSGEMLASFGSSLAPYFNRYSRLNVCQGIAADVDHVLAKHAIFVIHTTANNLFPADD